MSKKTKPGLLGDTTPTQAQIDKVKQNLSNLIQLNSDVLYGGNLKIENAFALLTLKDSSDLGISVGLNLLCGGFWAAAAWNSGPLAAAAANFCCGVVSHYSSNTPPNLLAATSQLITRFQNTSMQFQYDLQKFYSDPVTYWNQQYSGTVHTAFGSYPVTGSLADLSTVDVPSKNDLGYTAEELLCLKGVDQETWNVLLPNFVITEYFPEEQLEAKRYSEQQVKDWCAGFCQINPSYWTSYVYEKAKGWFGGDQSSYWVSKYNIGTGWVPLGDGHLSEQACNYLFSDLIDGYPNPNAVNGGLYQRSFVFTKMPNIRRTSHTYSY